MVVEKMLAQQSCANFRVSTIRPFPLYAEKVVRFIFFLHTVSAHLWWETASNKPLNCVNVCFSIAFSR